VIGAGNLASAMAPGASAAYARNISALVAHLLPQGDPVIDPADEVVGPMLVTHDGKALVK
jgi:NAD(P) transhydrogenase subunit alpha